MMKANISIESEYRRLKALFNSIEENKSKLVDNLIQQAAFMKVELDKLQNQILNYGAVQISSKGAQR